MRKYGSRATVVVTAVALGSIAFAGTALAGGGTTNGVGGNGGGGGKSNANCGVPVGVSAGVIGQGGDVTQCNATGGGGGNGGGGVDY
ncbi:MAG TPA: hypothetical protein VGM60_03575 [Pseudonocardia sp.]|jgi:hypothetical protein|uniref:hypothetical protein n=1 Tax=Pseudonocardia sp. TaxID=60912 RepID=UPI002F3F9EA2